VIKDRETLKEEGDQKTRTMDKYKEICKSGSAKNY
jgi:hypothetical protein